MSAVLLDVLGPPVSGDWDVPLNYHGFKHIGIRGNLKSASTVNTVYFNLLDSSLNNLVFINKGEIIKSGNNPNSAIIGPYSLSLDLGDSSNLFVTSFDMTIFDFATSDTFSSVSYSAVMPVPVDVDKIVCGMIQIAQTENIAYIRLGSAVSLDADSEIKVFGYRG